MSYWPNDDVNLDATYDFESNIDMNFDSYVDIDSYIDVDHDICIDVDIDGNEATFAIDLQAYGHDTAVDLNLVVVVQEGEWSSITASGYAAAS
jgi:hypothetical protein